MLNKGSWIDLTTPSYFLLKERLFQRKALASDFEEIEKKNDERGEKVGDLCKRFFDRLTIIRTLSFWQSETASLSIEFH